MRAYKGLEQVERAFGTFKGPELEIRPIHHRLEDRVRAHVLLCMLAYYLTWHLTRGLDAAAVHRRAAARSPPTPSPRPPARPPPSSKAQTKRTTNGEPCHSYRSLLAELATLTRNTIRLPGADASFDKLTQPTALQARALDLIDEHLPRHT